MELSPLAQLLIVAALAYAAGLLLGLSFYRGEIGPGQRSIVLGLAGGSTGEAAGKSRRRRRKASSFQERLGDRTRQAIVLLFMLAFITVLGLGFYSVMGAGAEALNGSKHQAPPHHQARRSLDGRP